MNVPDLVLSRRLPLTLDVDRLQGDLHRLTTGWQDHFADNYYTGSWNVLPLLTADGCEHDLVTPWEREFEPTPFLLSCAYFQEVLAQFECPLLRVRLHRLEPGAVIKTHVDYLFDDHLDFARIHVPIITDPAVEFFLAGERLMLEPGHAWFTEVAFPHRVCNRSDRSRVHLVLDCFANEWLETLLGFSPRQSRIEHRPVYDRVQHKYRAIDRRRTLIKRARKAIRMALFDPKAFGAAVGRRVRAATSKARGDRGANSESSPN